jgi:hypothetical protein
MFAQDALYTLPPGCFTTLIMHTRPTSCPTAAFFSRMVIKQILAACAVMKARNCKTTATYHGQIQQLGRHQVFHQCVRRVLHVVLEDSHAVPPKDGQRQCFRTSIDGVQLPILIQLCPPPLENELTSQSDLVAPRRNLYARSPKIKCRFLCMTPAFSRMAKRQDDHARSPPPPSPLQESAPSHPGRAGKVQKIVA